MSASTDENDLLRRVARLEERLSTVLDVTRLRIAGPAGAAVLEIGASPDGEPEIVLLDAAGRDRALLRIVGGECALELLGEDGSPRVRAAAGTGAAARVVLWAGSDRRVEMRAAPDGTAVVAVVEQRDRLRALLGVSASGDAVLSTEPARREDRP